MITFYHAPMSRSTRILSLVHELGMRGEVDLRQVAIRRMDGSGGHDPQNPHPDGKVPLVVHDGVAIWESVAIAQYLADLRPEAGLSVPPGTPQRGRYLSWLAWYAGVLEPLVVLRLQGLDSPALRRNFRSLDEAAARLAAATGAAPYLCGDRYTVADLLVASTFGWQEALTPDVPSIRDWVKRCLSRPANASALAEDRAMMAQAKAG